MKPGRVWAPGLRGSVLLLRECARIFPHLRCLCVRRSACPVCLRVSVCARTAVRGSVHVSRPCVTSCKRVGTVRTCSAQTTEGRGSGLCLGPGFPGDAVARLHPPMGTRGWVGRWRLSSHGYSEDRGNEEAHDAEVWPWTRLWRRKNPRERPNQVREPRARED